MQIRIVTLEREYGSGGAMIAKGLAARLGWKVWDEELTAEIARVAKVDHRAALRCDERCDSLLYRLFKVYARGSYERTLPLEGESQMFDADQMVAVLHRVVEDVASRGNSVIVGRGAPYILRNRADVFSVFIYASEEEKIRRIMSLGKSEREAVQLVQEVDSERAAFIRHYFNKEWPLRSLYNLMINSKYGDEHTVETILQEIASLEARAVPQAASR
ncbi:MAG TPA: cytidylate kinase-like family protein [Candidatus Acidoferrales bacterium]|jgi:cytidylate kinase|nr:cytidylate kinase-like family protein [Candidatus Acidoferrales bacterium]